MPKTKLTFKDFEWTPELAYVVGLLATDGNLSGDGRHIILRSSDFQLMETFKECLDTKARITKSVNNGYSKKICYRVQLGNVQLYRWLLTIGLFPNKTHVLGPIKILPKYFRDFLRGHLDGDGTIFIYEDNYNIYKGKRYLNTRIYTKFISVSERHIRWLHFMIKKYSPVKGALLYKKPKQNQAGMWEIKFSKYDSLKLFSWIYYKENLPCLHRKRDLAKNLLKHLKNNKLVRLIQP